MLTLVALDHIVENPWQPRLTHNETHSRAPTADIQQCALTKPETLGLFLLPAGGIVDADGTPLQLTPTVTLTAQRT